MKDIVDDITAVGYSLLIIGFIFFAFGVNSIAGTLGLTVTILGAIGIIICLYRVLKKTLSHLE